MNVEEIKEGAEHAHEAGEKSIGLTMAVTAVLLAMATLLSHRAHTEEVLLQGKIVDDWSFYQAKHGRAHSYGSSAEVAALLPNGKDVALRDYKKSLEEECGVPPEKGCSSPVKDSAILAPLLSQASAEKKDKEEAEEPAAKEGQAHKANDAEAHRASEAKEGEAHKAETKESGGAHAAKEKAEKEKPGKPGAVQIQEQAREREHEQALIEHQANFYDGSELLLEISIVLCSISLLAGSKLYWRMSFLTTIAGVAVALYGLLMLH
ncbi:MAG: DUF4337 domain-containing protein [Acidobacteriia bacterium]|nr:DUF4337 domain-containing protein [Terriglobia bacterium]